MTKAEAKKWVPTWAWTDAEKILAFDGFYEMAVTHLKNIKRRGCYDDYEEQHGIYENVIGLLGEEIWDVINTLTG